MARDYKDEYKKFQSSTEQKKNRAARNGRRLKLIKKVGKEALKGKDIHHYHQGGKLKTRVESASVNRGRREKSRLKKSKRRRWRLKKK
jgi:hypothetical protein